MSLLSRYNSRELDKREMNWVADSPNERKASVNAERYIRGVKLYSASTTDFSCLNVIPTSKPNTNCLARILRNGVTTGTFKSSSIAYTTNKLSKFLKKVINPLTSSGIIDTLAFRLSAALFNLTSSFDSCFERSDFSSLNFIS